MVHKTSPASDAGKGRYQVRPVQKCGVRPSLALYPNAAPWDTLQNGKRQKRR